MKETIWKDIPGYEGIYKINDSGVIKSYNFNKQRVRKPYVDERGYHYILLYNNSVLKRFCVHRLVALTFINNPNNLKEVNHINARPSDNRVSNLEWCTRKENMAHAKKMRLFKHGAESHFSKYDEVTVMIIKEAFNAGFRQCKISDYLKIPRQTVHNIVRHCWTHINVL